MQQGRNLFYKCHKEFFLEISHKEKTLNKCDKKGIFINITRKELFIMPQGRNFL